MNDQRVVAGADATSRDNAESRDSGMLLGQRVRRSGYVDYSIPPPERAGEFTQDERLELVVAGNAPLFYARRGRLSVSIGSKELARFVAHGLAPDGSGPFVTIGPLEENVDVVPGEQPGFAFPITRNDCSAVCHIHVAFDSTSWLVSRIAITRSVAAANAANFGT